MVKRDILVCPGCGRKTRTLIRDDTVLINYPLYCPRCKHETLVNVKQLKIEVLEQPDARAPQPKQLTPQTQSR